MALWTPLSEGAHAFVIRNTGGGPLELTLGAPSSPGIRGEITQRHVPPGGTSEVRVTWTTGPSQPEYDEGVMVNTNDTSHATIPLTIRGKVRVRLAAEPKWLVIPEVLPGGPTTVSTLVYSQTWEQLSITKVSCSIDQTTCTFGPATSEALESVQAESGYLVTVALPPNLPSGPFKGVVRIESQRSEGASETQTVLELPISGKVLRRLAVYGDGVQENGVVDLGIHPPDRAWQHRLLLKVRDADTELRLTNVQTKPDFFQVTLAPYGTEADARLYHLDISVPAHVPQCIYRGTQLGELKLTFDHPRIQDLSLRLAFAVMPRR